MVKTHPARGQRIHVRRVHTAIAVATESRGQIIDNDEQDVRLFHLGGGAWAAEICKNCQELE
jgi:hypothetical protein